MATRALTDRAIKALKPAPTMQPYDVMDSVVPGFGVRVMGSGQRSFIVRARFPGSRNPTRRALGAYGELTLEKARNMARGWFELLSKGEDPAREEERLRLEADRRRENTFASVIEDYLRLTVIGPDHDNPRQRKGREGR
jgi:hypothetical protein